MEKVKFVCCFVLVLVLKFSLVCSQYVQSPCPGIFDYESDDTGIYGRIVVRPGTPVSQLVVQINFTVTVQLFSDYYGSLELANERFALRDYNQGSPMRYRVHFPVTSPLPRVTWLAVNGETICAGPGDVLRPNRYLTTFSLQHTSFIGVRPSVPRPQTQSNFVNDYGDNQVYTIHGIDNNWNNVNVVVPLDDKQSRPVYEQTSRPSSPFLITQNFNDNSEDRPQRLPQRPPQRPPQRLPVNRIPNRPVIQQPTLPVYEEPVTQDIRPQRPIEDTLYYPQESVTQAARPARPRPVNQQTPSSSNIECGVVGGKIPLIVQGTPYNRGDVPWLVAIYRNTRNDLAFICGGTLVSDRHVITAAHCMHLRSVRTSYQNMLVKIGVYDLSAWDDDITVTRTLIDAKSHEAYNSSSLENDILILTLRLPVKFNEYIRPACLWSGDTTLQRVVDTSGIVAGWGEQYNGGPKAGIPNLVHLPIVSTDTCRAKNAAFHQLTSSHTLCAGDLKGSGPCKGDSGGGLYIQHEGKWRLRGVVSISLRTDDGRCNLQEYLVFTDTAQYLPWIRQILQA
ncbi:unnamed protein product [Arctia plantaginis]|uniref:Peptidase S1 domain-containing protein n=1 Tax=Arctia plantaginis TaxID=874455 RepID=A0A8S0YTE9_ARCPL|nr:unnamed protein product [Arctia plantaginis]